MNRADIPSLTVIRFPAMVALQPAFLSASQASPMTGMPAMTCATCSAVGMFASSRGFATSTAEPVALVTKASISEDSISEGSYFDGGVAVFLRTTDSGYFAPRMTRRGEQRLIRHRETCLNLAHALCHNAGVRGTNWVQSGATTSSQRA